jgi:hypothetical protein
MKKAPLGCLTPTGLISAGLTLAVIALLSLLRGGVLFSPGPLNAVSGQPLGGFTAHADFGGQCSLCHAPFWDPAGMSGRCQECHTTIAAERQDPATLHGAIYRLNPDYACQDCHPDHRGPEASLTDFKDGAFPHDMLGYSLAGHASLPDGESFTCGDCHGTDLTTFDAVFCQTCHQDLDAAFMDAHLLNFGSGCLECHDGVDRYGDDFDHNAFLFPLTGLHIGIACSECHPEARSIAHLRAAPQDCASCHNQDDVHLGSLGEACATCHTPAGWVPSIYDHNLSLFPLVGAHVTAPCASCHADGVYKGVPTECFACHAGEDAHAGKYGTDCGSCHTPAGWSPALFDHNLSAFPLTGKHVSVACESCHPGKVFLGTPTDCYSCHAAEDAHAGQYGTGCASCHSTSGWTPAFFDHNLSGFPLTGAHTGLACTQCHGGGVFSGLSSACAACHADPAFHAGLFSGMACSQCHGTSSWTPASYSLSHPGGCDGNCIDHEDASCRDCHTSDLNTATCTKCHDNNNPGDDD